MLALEQGMHAYSLSPIQLYCDSVDYRLLGSFCPRDSLGKNTGVGCHFPLQGNHLDPGTEPASLELPGGFFIT